MTNEVPRSIATGRQVAIGLLITAMAITVLLVLWIVAAGVTAPPVV
ncbi:hypothetical protein [Lentzea aerocolonigenes]|jgi:hypothetical protein|nr:hypothetical protein [Lentzea aerocolonigenes]MCP2246909.1 hypothetical protein [Lentzea aerocolonigenes]